MSKTFNLNNLEITWLGHASFKIKSPNLIVYIDPYQISGGEAADVIFTTHDHFDHYDQVSIKALKKDDTMVVGPESVISQPEADPPWAGKSSGKKIKAGQIIKIKGANIKAVPAYNINKFRSPGIPYHPRGSGVGFVVNLAGKTIYHAGDTDKVPEMTELGPIDLALLPIGGTYTMDEEEAAEAVKLIKPKVVIPMHYGTLDQTPGNPEKFKELVGDVAEVIIL
jgi:L-ascorbate metabolism protein UlaG (beta-lactamase superfamily)